MELLSPAALKELATFDAHPDLVVSLCLDVDGRRYPRKADYEKPFAAMVRSARSQLRSRDLSRTAGSQAEADLRRISDHVLSEFSRRDTRGLALFACADRLFKSIPLPVPIRSRIHVNRHPFIRPLNAVLSTHRRWGLVIVGRKTARIFVYQMGVPIEHAIDVVDDVPGKHDQGGWSQARYSRHIEQEVARHLKHTAAVCKTVVARDGVEHLLLAGPTEVVTEFQRSLPAPVRRLISGRISLKATAGLDDVKAKIRAADEAADGREGAQLVESIRAALGSGNGAVAGLEDVLKALSQKRVGTLAVSKGLTARGWRCDACSALAPVGSRCSACDAAMASVDDVVEEAIEEAVAQVAVARVVSGSADLDVLGGIAALLRY